MAGVDIEFEAGSASVSAYTKSQVTIEAENVDVSSILTQIDIADAVEAYGEDDLLDKIGKDKAIEYFGLEEE